MREALEHALALIEGANGLAIREDASWPMYREAFQAALATPSAPVSAPSPAGGVRERVRAAVEVALAACHQKGYGVALSANAEDTFVDALLPIAALSSPATPEPVSAPAGEVVEALKATRSIVSDGAMVGFNCHDGDWAQRLYANQARLSTLIRILSNPAPGHGEGGL